MRVIECKLDESGRTEVEIKPDKETGKFFTKRDLDRVLRAIKQAYRRAIREYRKSEIIKEFIEKGKKDDYRQEQVSGSNEEERSDEKLGQSEQNGADNSRGDSVPEGTKSPLARAIEAKRKREQRETAAGESREDASRGSSS